MNLQVFLRKWHRWIAFPAAAFLLVAAVTGIILTFTEFFGAAEAQREHTRALVSPVSTQTSSAILADALARAQSRVVAEVGSAPLDKVEWQFKGDVPTLTFYLGKPGGGEDRKITVNARTGALIRSETYTDKPWLLRLHSGELYGGGGLVLAMGWGLALVLLIVSGIVVYLKMRRPRLTGIRRIFWVLVLGSGLCLAPRVRADSPFYTDDPEFSPGWEIKGGFTTEDNAGGSVRTAVLDWNYAVVSNVRLNLTTYAKSIEPSGGLRASGYGDTEFKVKWRFRDQDPQHSRAALGIAPKLYLPTASTSRGLGDGVWRFQLPLQIGKTSGRWYHFGEVGYQWAFRRDVSDSAYGGAGTLYSVTEHFAMGTELYGSVPSNDHSQWQLLTTLGLVYTFNSHWQIKGSLSRTLRDPARGGPDPSAVFYVVTNF